MTPMVKRVVARYAPGDLPVATGSTDPDFNLLEFPDTRQGKNFTCGASSVQSILYYYGENIREDELADTLKSDPEDGTQSDGMVQLFHARGLRTISGEMTIEDLKRNIDMGIPTMIPIQAWPDDDELDKDLSASWEDGHWIVAIGYAPGTIIFDDPVLLDNHGYMAIEDLESRWHDKNGDTKLDHFGIAVWGKEPAFKERTMIRIEARVAARWIAAKS